MNDFVTWLAVGLTFAALVGSSLTNDPLVRIARLLWALIFMAAYALDLMRAALT